MASYKRKTNTNLKALSDYAESKKDFELFKAIAAGKITELGKFGLAHKKELGEEARAFDANFDRYKRVVKLVKTESNHDFELIYRIEIEALTFYITEVLRQKFVK